MPSFRKSSGSDHQHFGGKHRFEHWYCDNQVYFITARCRDRSPSFHSDAAKAIFWDRFEHYTKEYGFVPWVTTLMDNHYHTLGYIRTGDNLGTMMQRLHGSVAKLVNDELRERLTPFWGDHKHSDYMDGCIRDELQCRRAYRYTLIQAVRHGVANDWREYVHTRVNVELEKGVARALELKAFMDGVPYARYERSKRRKGLDREGEQGR